MTSPAAPLLSLCMIVRNEAHCLDRCLTSVRDLVDETVVVDTGSTDGTQDIALRHGARIVQSTWENDFSRARNLSLSEARGRWVLVLDADEYLLEHDKAKIRELLQQHAPAAVPAGHAFNLVQKSPSRSGGSGMMVNIVRLFPNRPDVRYAWPVHEQVVVSLERAGIPIANTDVVIMHTGYADPARNHAKQRRNQELLARQIASGVDVTPLTYFLLAGSHLDLNEPEIALERYRECQALAHGGAGHAEIARAAAVRIVSCLNALRRWPETLASTPTKLDAIDHPELFTLRGEAEAALGRVDAARSCYEAVLDCSDRAYVPPCDLSRLKAIALGFLGEYWYRRGQARLGVELLRSAKQIHEQGLDFTSADLLRACELLGQK